MGTADMEQLTWEQLTWEQLTRPFWTLYPIIIYNPCQEMASSAVVNVAASVDDPQPPVDGQAGAMPGSAVEREICVICHDELNVHDTDNLMVLWCGHKFHSSCVLEWRNVARRTERHCPFRCETSQHVPEPLLALIH